MFVTSTSHQHQNSCDIIATSDTHVDPLSVLPSFRTMAASDAHVRINHHRYRIPLHIPNPAPPYFEEKQHWVLASATSIALCEDGSTLIIGKSNTGVYVFVRDTEGTYTQQGPTLLATDAIEPAAQGKCVAISADGNTIAWSGDRDNRKGATWVYTRTNGVWTEQAKMVGSSATNQGASIAINNAGTMVVSSDTGGVWTHTLQNGTWLLSGSKLSTTIGNSLALNGDGSMLATYRIVGSDGTVTLFQRDEQAATWTSMATLSQPGARYFGSPIQFARNVNVFITQSPTFGAWVYAQDQLRGTKIQAGSDYIPYPTYSSFSSCSTISADGMLVAASGVDDNGFTGATWVYQYDAALEDWVLFQPTKLVGSNDTSQGNIMAMSGDGATLVIAGTNGICVWVRLL